MKNIFSNLFLAATLLIFSVGGVHARECTECKRSAQNAVVKTKAAVCKRAQSTAELNVNNVRALINGYGNMWYDGSVAQYHIPKDGNIDNIVNEENVDNVVSLLPDDLTLISFFEIIDNLDK